MKDSNTGLQSSGEWGDGFHLSTYGDHGVDCPVCTCYNDSDYLFSKLKGRPFAKIKCKGCRRNMNCIINFINGSFTLIEI